MSMNQTLNSCRELLACMVRIESINAHLSGRPDAEIKLAEELDAIAQGMGLKTQRLPVPGRGFNLLVSVEVAAGQPWLLFQSHMDTVAVAGMTIDPFGAELRDGRMYGRGSCDTKASGAGMLWALKDYARQAHRPNNVALLFSIDEEITKTGITVFVKDQFPQLGWKLRGCIVGEPTRFKPIVAHNGVVRWPIRTRGVAAHSSDPSRGKSAIAMMVKTIDAVEHDYIARLSAIHALTGRAVASINLIKGGTQINIIPEACEIEIDRRVVPGESGNEVLPAVEQVLAGLRAANPGLVVEQGEPYIDEPLDPAGNEGWIASVGSILTRHGVDATPIGAPFGTDGSTLNAVGPTIVLGPGDIAQAHTADEWIELSEVDRAPAIYLDLMNA